jgi:hypothetical protein
MALENEFYERKRNRLRNANSFKEIIRGTHLGSLTHDVADGVAEQLLHLARLPRGESEIGDRDPIAMRLAFQFLDLQNCESTSKKYIMAINRQ